MQQHAAAKRAYPDAIVFFRLGDFYEMFEDDALVCARLLDLTLTSRNKGKADEVPMAGVPHHSAHGYVKRLLDAGHKVAICEQMADPATVKGIVPREVVRVLTPGTVTEQEHLGSSLNNFLSALEVTATETAVALLDISTGELRVARFGDLAAALGELARSTPREILIGGPAASQGDAQAAVAAAVPGVAVREDRDLDDAGASVALGELDREARRMPAASRHAAARALRFARDCNPSRELFVRRIIEWDPTGSLVIDPVAQTHLELVEASGGKTEGSLLSVLDVTRTAPGARLLRRRLLAPLTEVARIRRRHDQIGLFVENPKLRDELRAALSDVGDLERLAVRARLGEATPRDLGAIRDSLWAARRAVAALSSTRAPEERTVLGIDGSGVDTIDDLADALGVALVDRPPAQAKEGAIFREGYDAELDETTALKKSGAEKMVELEGELKEQTGISTLKVRYTRVFGWYVEVSRNHVARVPESWRRKQTVASGERYTLPQVDDLADRIATAEENHRVRELALLEELGGRVQTQSARIAALSDRLARWDWAAALAEIAHRYDYARPEVEEADLLEIVEGRHAVVERLAARGRFVPNDVRLEAGGERLWIVTGPNMAGKSTLLRQTALITIMAQMGGFVPARSARIGIVDRVLSRVGASDNLSRGESTFMVEMRETAEILRRATARSLVILDEIGRGTSTFDGLAIAWAVAEYLDEVVGCRTLFATHYHELTALGESSRHAANVSVSAQEIEGDVVFLHHLVRGAASRSYGVAVAKLAGLPESVLARSRAVLEALENGGASPAGTRSGRSRDDPDQLSLFAPPSPGDPREEEVLATLRAVDTDRLAPIDALTLLARLKGLLEPTKGGA